MATSAYGLIAYIWTSIFESVRLQSLIATLALTDIYLSR